MTTSLVLPITMAIVRATSKDSYVIRYMYEDGKLQEVVKSHDYLCDEARQVREILHSENKKRFVDRERDGHFEDLLITTILDPRFKLMNFNDCSLEYNHLAETYLKRNYLADWSPSAVSKANKDETCEKASTSSALEAPTTTAPMFVKKVKI